MQGLNTTRQMRHQILQMLATEMLQSCKGQLHLTARGLISCVIITWDHIEIKDIYRYTVRCLGSPGQKCVCNDNNMKNVVFAVAKRELLHVALCGGGVLLRGLFFFRPRGHISIHVITSTMRIEKLHFIEVNQLF